MAWERHEIQSYTLYGMAHNTPGYENVYAFITLRVATQGVHPMLWFHRDDGSAILPNAVLTNGRIYGRFGERAFADFVDILRNEKPVYFFWNPDSTGVHVSTGPEPVGDGETP